MTANFLDNLPPFAAEALVHLENAMASVQQKQLAHLNRGNQGELFLLKYLHMRDQATTPSELSLAMDSSTARISALLRTLEQKEQIERQVDQDDRRYVLVTITEDGKRRVNQEIGQIREGLARVFLDLGEDDTREFLRLAPLFLDLIKKHMKSLV